MREIKFRAWDSKNNKWLVDFQLDQNGVPYEYQGGLFDGTWVKISQFTGLKDKNGVELYEDDIITVEWMDDETHDIGYVVWFDAGFHLCMEGEGFSHDPHDWHEEHPDLWDDPETLNIDIIGNLYENPELLK